VAAKPTERANLCDHGNQTTIRSAMKPDSIKKNNLLLDTARELRQTMTKQEKHLWYDFLRYYPIKIYKQRIIDSFIVDFYCAKAKLVIEIDGAQHYTSPGKNHDRLRTEALQKYDLMVLRFSNNDVDSRFNYVCNTIDAVIRERSAQFEGEAL
jgi:very-short-patch-repair endonuclease